MCISVLCTSMQGEPDPDFEMHNEERIVLVVGKGNVSVFERMLFYCTGIDEYLLLPSSPFRTQVNSCQLYVWIVLNTSTYHTESSGQDRDFPLVCKKRVVQFVYRWVVTVRHPVFEDTASVNFIEVSSK